MDLTSGLYHLVLALEKPQRLVVGSLGRHDFPPGWYVYTGSARGCLIPRLSRHLRKEKKRHWHIDALTLVAHMEEILVDLSGTSTECQRHQDVMQLPGAHIIVLGFGSSDCRCLAHLAHFAQRPSFRSQPSRQTLCSLWTPDIKTPAQTFAVDPSRSLSKLLSFTEQKTAWLLSERSNRKVR
ncbi:MAG: GIY-YIG nuclease family protein [Nitrospirae bacterium]|nr:MAG: GIY-YIG nuclease family protein [Nitrospirota bacterium]